MRNRCQASEQPTDSRARGGSSDSGGGRRTARVARESEEEVRGLGGTEPSGGGGRSGVQPRLPFSGARGDGFLAGWARSTDATA